MCVCETSAGLFCVLVSVSAGSHRESASSHPSLCPSAYPPMRVLCQNLCMYVSSVELVLPPFIFLSVSRDERPMNASGYCWHRPHPSVHIHTQSDTRSSLPPFLVLSRVRVCVYVSIRLLT
mmetsp:Transcript_23780/g.68377  ORF Transcript_23780/g.68377 Transcript_23780/m.68377 type:complete len:121 (+) Transcript_23780:1692-2054(+)